MGRTRLTGILSLIRQEDMSKRLHPEANSIGFLLQHIAEVELLFAKNIFGMELKVTISTVGKTVRDTGRFTDLGAAQELLALSTAKLEEAISSIPDEGWRQPVTTAEFGTVTRAEALARIITHSAYHAGQAGMILKYGSF
jgi:uncharacterized damage-inducible protein DinB